MRAILASAALVVLLAGCGRGAVIQAPGAQRSVADLVAQKTGFRPGDVTCPAGVPARVGGTFDCRFTGPQSKPYLAHVRILKVQGRRVEFFIITRPAGS